MPGYVHQAVEKFHHGTNHTMKAVDTPHPYKAIKKHGLPMTRHHKTHTPGDKTPTKDHGHFSVLFQGSRPNNANCPQHPRNRTDTGNRYYQRKGRALPNLCHNTPQCHNKILQI